MCRDESLFVAWFDAESYDIECCHFSHPTLRRKSCAVFYCCARPIAPIVISSLSPNWPLVLELGVTLYYRFQLRTIIPFLESA
jgi:hypothetical protein